MENKKEFLRAIKFTLFSISAGIIQILLTTLLEKVLMWEYWPSYLIGLLASIIWNFTINRKVTFKSSNNIKKSMLLVLLFYAVFTPVSTILGDSAVNSGIDGTIVLIITMILNFALEYLYTRFFVYRGSCDTAIDEKKETII